MKFSKSIYIFLIIITLLIMSAYVYDKTTVQKNIVDIEVKSSQITEIKQVAEVTSNINNSNVLKIGAVSYPPYYYFEDGEFRGDFAEIAIEAFTRMGIKFEIKEYPWPRMLEMLKVGELDVLLDVYITEERLEYLDFSKEKFISYNEIFFKLADSDIEFSGDFSELSEYKIGTVEGFYYGDSFEKAVNDGIVNVEYVSSFDQNVFKLINKRTDLIISVATVGEKIIEELGYSDVIEPMEPFVNSADSYFAFSKSNNLKEVRDNLDEIIRQMYEDGTIEVIYNK